MNISRRQFLTRALAALPVVVAPAAMVEALMPRKSIFLSPRGGWLVAEESNTVYLVNQDYLVLPPGHEPIIELLKRRMQEAIDRIAEGYWSDVLNPPIARIGGIDVYMDRSLPKDTFEFRQA